MSNPRKYRCIKEFRIPVWSEFGERHEPTTVTVGETFVRVPPLDGYDDCVRLVSTDEPKGIHFRERTLNEFFEEVER